MHAAKGLTLIELLLSLALLGILSALALPSYLQLIQTQSADRLRDDLFAALMSARNQATTLGLPVAICTASNLYTADPTDLRCASPGKDWLDGWFVFVDLNEDREHQPDERILSVYEDKPADIELGYSRTKALRFDRQGRVLGYAGSFYLCKSAIDYVVRLAVSSTGRLRFAEPESGHCD